MNYLLDYLPEDYLKKIAEYFAAQRPLLPPPAVPEVSNEVLARDCMQSVAGHLTEHDVKAVAAFLAARPAPPDLTPAPQGAFILPFARE